MDIHSLHPTFVGEWHPETRAKVLRWLDISSDGDITPFQDHLAAYNALEVSSYWFELSVYISNVLGCYRYPHFRFEMREPIEILL
jgi:hypothetical protein